MVRCDIEILRMSADVAYGPLRIPKLNGVVIFRPEPVAQNEGGNAMLVEPFSDIRSFVVKGEMNVTTAGEHNDSAASRIRSGSFVDGESWYIFGRGTLGARCRAGPERHDGMLLGERSGGREEQDGNDAFQIPSSFLHSANCLAAYSSSSDECAAETWTRMRALPCGTTGNEK